MAKVEEKVMWVEVMCVYMRTRSLLPQCGRAYLLEELAAHEKSFKPLFLQYAGCSSYEEFNALLLPQREKLLASPLDAEGEKVFSEFKNWLRSHMEPCQFQFLTTGNV